MKERTRTYMHQILRNNLVRQEASFLVVAIPEIQNMVGFDQNNPQHHLDLWNHTLTVLDNLDTPDLETNMAALLHDLGKTVSYQDTDHRHFRGHENASAILADMILERLEYDDEFIENVHYLIATHDTLIDPDNLDNTKEMINKRLSLQYADAMAHHPDYVDERIKKLDEINQKLNSKTRQR